MKDSKPRQVRDKAGSTKDRSHAGLLKTLTIQEVNCMFATGNPTKGVYSVMVAIRK